MTDIMDKEAREDFERAHSVSLIGCPGECAIHLILCDEDGLVFADAPITRETATKFGQVLLQVGAGETPEEEISSVLRLHS